MTWTQTRALVEFTKAAMDQIREHAMIEESLDGFLEFDNGWTFVFPGGRDKNGAEKEAIIYDFRIVPHGRLVVRVAPSKAFQQIAWIRNKDEAREAVLLFLRGVDPPSFGERAV